MVIPNPNPSFNLDLIFDLNPNLNPNPDFNLDPNLDQSQNSSTTPPTTPPVPLDLNDLWQNSVVDAVYYKALKKLEDRAKRLTTFLTFSVAPLALLCTLFGIQKFTDIESNIDKKVEEILSSKGAELQKLRKSMKTDISKISNAKAEAESTLKKLKESNNNIINYQNTLRMMEANIATSNERNKQLIDTLQNTIADVQDSTSKLEFTNGKASGQIESINKLIEDAQSNRFAINTDTKKATKIVEDLEREIVETNNQEIAKLNRLKEQIKICDLLAVNQGNKEGIDLQPYGLDFRIKIGDVDDQELISVVEVINYQSSEPQVEKHTEVKINYDIELKSTKDSVENISILRTLLLVDHSGQKQDTVLFELCKSPTI